MKLLIVDDEPLIHKSIEFCLGELEGEPISTVHAYNGSDMLHQLGEQAFDLALVDIQMPGLDGLSAIAKAKEKWPRTEYYIMSGYSEFAYAREAVHLGVSDYLIKPVSPEDLSGIVSALRKKQAAEHDRIRENFRTWLLGSLHKQALPYLYTPGYFVGIALLVYDSEAAQKTLWVPEFGSLREDMLSLPCPQGLLLMGFSTQAVQIQNILNCFPQKQLPQGVTVFTSSVYASSAAAELGLNQILSAAPGRVLSYTGIRCDICVLPELPEKQRRIAACWISLRDAWLAHSYSDYAAAQIKVQRCLGGMTEQETCRAADFLSVVMDHPVTEISAALSDGAKALLGQNKSLDRIEAIMDYIDNHFCEELSIGDLANRFGLTPNYLSSLLKSRRDIRFTDYLTDLRLKKAKQLLLSTNLSVKEISEQIGYHSQSHFTKVFFEKCHYTPMEFKRQHSGSSSKE